MLLVMHRDGGGAVLPPGEVNWKVCFGAQTPQFLDDLLWASTAQGVESLLIHASVCRLRRSTVC